MGFLKYLLFFISVGSLVSCGGGKGSNSTNSQIQTGFYGSHISLSSLPNGPYKSYVGNTSEATITNENANKIVQSFFLSDFTNDVPNIESKASSAQVSKQLSNNKILKQLSFFKKIEQFHQKHWSEYREPLSVNKTSAAREAITTSGTGSISGSYTVTGYANENGTGKVTIVWNNYNDGTGATIEGTSTYEAVGVYIDVQTEYIEQTDFIETFQSLNIDYGNSSIIVDGEIRKKLESLSSRTTTIYDLDLYNSATRKWVSLDNLKYIDSIFSYQVTGRYYHEDYGYISLTTLETLRICTNTLNCDKDITAFASGELKFSGTNSINIKTESDQHYYMINYYSGNTLSDSEMYQWGVNSSAPINRKPYINSLQVLPQNTQLDNATPITIAYEAGDADFDTLTVDFKWYNNYSLIEGVSGNTLLPEKLEAGGRLSVTITVSDGTTTTTKSINDINVATVYPEITFPSENIITQENIHLLTSTVSDKKNRNLIFKWTANTAFVKVLSPESANTPIKIRGAGTFNVELKVTAGKAISTKTITITRKSELTFSDPVTIATLPVNENSKLFDYVIEDITNDAKKDIIYMFRSDASDQHLQLGVLSQQADGSFSPPKYYPAPHNFIDIDDQDYKISIADINGDGLNDVIVSWLVFSWGELGNNGQYNNTINKRSFSVYYQTQSQQLVLNETRQLSVKSNPSFFADINNDSRIDMISNYGDFYIQNADSSFSNDQRYKGLIKSLLGSEYLYIYDISDMTGDNLPDLIVGSLVGNSSEDKYGILPMNKDGFEPYKDIGVQPALTLSNIKASDINQDGLKDLAINTADWSSTFRVLLQQNDGTFSSSSSTMPAIVRSDFRLLDTNNDQKIDILSGRYVYQQDTNHGFPFAEPLTIPTTWNSYGNTYTDLNGDGLIDLIRFVKSKENNNLLLEALFNKTN